MIHLTLGDSNLIANFEAAMALKGCGFMDEEINALYYEQLIKDRVEDEVLVRMLLDDTTAAIERELK